MISDFLVGEKKCPELNGGRMAAVVAMAKSKLIYILGRERVM